LLLSHHSKLVSLDCLEIWRSLTFYYITLCIRLCLTFFSASFSMHLSSSCEQVLPISLMGIEHSRLLDSLHAAVQGAGVQFVHATAHPLL